MSLTLATRLRLAPHVRFRRFEDEGVAVDQSSAEAVVFNDVAARILELADGSRTLAECAGLLGDEFEAEGQAIEQDVLRFAGELVEAGLAVPAP
ncbi:MAG TPA: PqqD family protein [Thermoanaerobaculia bacterium]|jgi:hypothetical protein|nr:PqqD family protein [Thermoanaerobaculia bacterium]